MRSADAQRGRASSFPSHMADACSPVQAAGSSRTGMPALAAPLGPPTASVGRQRSPSMPAGSTSGGSQSKELRI